MQASNKQLYIAAALICGGVLVFFGILALMGVDPDERPLGVAEWILGGMLILPGFFYLIKWRRMRDLAKRDQGAGPQA